MKRYPTAMKRKLVAEYATGDFPRREFLAKHQIPNSTFHQWIHKQGLLHKTQEFEIRQQTLENTMAAHHLRGLPGSVSPSRTNGGQGRDRTGDTRIFSLQRNPILWA